MTSLHSSLPIPSAPIILNPSFTLSPLSFPSYALSYTPYINQPLSLPPLPLHLPALPYPPAPFTSPLLPPTSSPLPLPSALSKEPYLFYFLEKFTFVTFSSKIEWVSTIGVFFFPVPEKKIQGLKRVSEWSLNFFQEKKIQEKKDTNLGKKNTTYNAVKIGLSFFFY